MSNTIEIMGGLGNQLFQIFTLIAYSLKTRRPFYFENKPITNGHRKKYYWDTALLDNLKKFVENSKKIDHFYNEHGFHYIPISINDHTVQSGKNIKLNGYFQSYKYFEEYKEDIFKLIQLKETQNIVKEKVIAIIPELTFNKTISMHFRVGDYAHQQQNHPLMPVEYYEKALSTLITEADNTEFNVLYFCEENDIKYVNNKINYLRNKDNFKNLIFIKIPEQLDDWEQIIVMSLCKYHIIANSTFSWWGAYFEINNDDKLIYYPNKWFGSAIGKIIIEDLFPSEWKKINIE